MLGPGQRSANTKTTIDKGQDFRSTAFSNSEHMASKMSVYQGCGDISPNLSSFFKPPIAKPNARYYAEIDEQQNFLDCRC